VSQKHVPTYFLLWVCQLWKNFNTNRYMFWNERLTKLCIKFPLHLKWVVGTRTTLGNLKWQIEPSMQYVHVHFNESLNSYKHDCLRNHQTCHIICTSYSWNVYLQRIPRSQMSMDWDDASKMSEQSKLCWLLNVRLAMWRQHLHARHFEHVT